MDNISFETLVVKTGLDDAENWKGDPRNRFVNLLTPLTENTEYYWKINTGDKSKKILELYKHGITKRLMGISGKQDMTINAFFNPDFHRTLKQVLDIPDNQKEYRSQPHMNLRLDTVWNIVCVATGKKDLIQKP